jgi:surface protein
MFSGASSFNQPLNDWNVSSATDMDFMFFQANDFDQNLGEWYVVLNSTEIDASAAAPGIVGTISAQNQFLRGQNPTYAIGMGGDSGSFNRRARRGGNDIGAEHDPSRPGHVRHRDGSGFGLV